MLQTQAPSLAVPQEHERDGEAGEEQVPKLQRQNPRDEHDRAVLGLALYALSSCFLATALVFTKKLSAPLAVPSRLSWQLL